MDAAEILKRKGKSVFTVAPEVKVREAMRLMLKYNVGSLVVQDKSDRVVGIVTERDIFKLTYEHEGKIMDVQVAAVMTDELLVAFPEDPVPYLKGLITENRIRHLPVMVEGKLVGIISIGDIIKEEISEVAVGNRNLKNYIATSYSA